jgi:hypothetical protein
MKRIFTVVFNMLLASCLAFSQTGGDKNKLDLNPQPLPPGAHGKTQTSTATTTAHKGGKKGHKGGKKGKKSSGGSTTPTPK